MSNGSNGLSTISVIYIMLTLDVFDLLITETSQTNTWLPTDISLFPFDWSDLVVVIGDDD